MRDPREFGRLVVAATLGALVVSVLPAVGAVELTVNLVCVHCGSAGSSFVDDSALTVIFIPSR